MNTEELSKRYMIKYNDLVEDFSRNEINQLVEDLNNAITQSDMSEANELYNKVSDWNAQVEKLLGARDALNHQYHYLHLPSPALFSIIFDGEEKVWKFNTEV